MVVARATSRGGAWPPGGEHSQQEGHIEITKGVIRRGHLRTCCLDKDQKGVRKLQRWASGRCVRGRETLQYWCHWRWTSIPTGARELDAVLNSFQRGLVSAHTSITSLPGPPILPADTPGLGLAPAVPFSGLACCVCSVPITLPRVFSSKALRPPPACASAGGHLQVWTLPCALNSVLLTWPAPPPAGLSLAILSIQPLPLVCIRSRVWVPSTSPITARSTRLLNSDWGCTKHRSAPRPACERSRWSRKCLLPGSLSHLSGSLW